ncbi:LCP family protein [Herbiconiux sp. P18]|uniref:LCP family protein n=1 Tax=Herbiconiux liangxiaofengii TaxID=3342795 RepID=UPI0035BB6CBA
MTVDPAPRRFAAALVLGAVLPGAGHLLLGLRRVGMPLLALSTITLLSVVAVTLRLALHPLDAVALAGAVDVLGAVGVLAAGWIVFVAASTGDLVRRVHPVPRRGRTAAVAVLLVPAVVCSLVAASAFTGRGIVDSVFSGGSALTAHDGRYNILVVGADRAPGRSVVMPDSISVVSVDVASGRTAVVGVDRTTQNFDFPAGSALAAQFPDGNRCLTGCELNHTYPYGNEHPELWPESDDPGMSSLTEAVEGYTGLAVSGYVYVELDAFVRLIDAVGGVTVDVGVEVPRTGVPDVGSDQLTVVGPPIATGVQHMDGDTALWFARSRFASSNSERMQRQGCIEDALLAQLDPADALGAFLSLAGTTEGLRTDIPVESLGVLASLADRARTQPVARVDLTHPLVEPLQPDLGVVRSAVEEALAGGEGEGDAEAGAEAEAPAPAPVFEPATPSEAAPGSPAAATAPSAEPVSVCTLP